MRALPVNAGEIVSVTTLSVTDTPVTVYPLIVKSEVVTVVELMFAENVTSIVVSEVAADDIMVTCFSVLRLSVKDMDSEREIVIDLVNDSESEMVSVSEREKDVIAFTASDSERDSVSAITVSSS